MYVSVSDRLSVNQMYSFQCTTFLRKDFTMKYVFLFATVIGLFVAGTAEARGGRLFHRHARTRSSNSCSSYVAGYSGNIQATATSSGCVQCNSR
jgi:hypothetical protein